MATGGQACSKLSGAESQLQDTDIQVSGTLPTSIISCDGSVYNTGAMLHAMAKAAHYGGDKQKLRITLTRRGWMVASVVCLCMFYALELGSHMTTSSSSRSSRPPPGRLLVAPQHQQQLVNSHIAAGAAQGQSSALPDVTLKYFPQAARCTTNWMQEYGQLHADILAGRTKARHLVSVAVEAGLADRLSGLVTHFWHAVVTRRSFTAVTYGDVPSFASVCDAPFFNWAAAAPAVPPEALEPLHFTYKGIRGYPAQNRTLPEHLQPEDYRMLYLVNGPARNLTVYQRTNLSRLFTPDPTTILAASNRGRSFGLANNPWHKQQFWELGVPPTDAFMCGFFAMCSPVAAVQQYYRQYWEALLDPSALKIGIQIRMGDRVFKQPAGGSSNSSSSDAAMEQVLKQGAAWFECAQRLEAAFAAPGQKVLWYLNSDSQQLRKAAKQKYGAKLVTDDALQMTHPDCFQDQAINGGAAGSNSSSSAGAPSACQQHAMDEALQHSLGAMLTFSLTDLHVITRASGFGRLGAWLSGQWGNIYQVGGAQDTCVPGKPVLPEQSAFTYSGV